MTQIINQKLLLKKLLSKFVNIMYISDGELEWMHDYILSPDLAKVPKADDSDVYETLVYLRDLAQESKYNTIEELFTYFEDRVQNLDKLIEPLLAENNDDLTGMEICRVFNGSFKTDSIRALTGSFIIGTSCLPADIDRDLYNRINNDNSISNTENEYKELGLATHWLKSINVFRDVFWNPCVLPNRELYYFKHYFESFSHPAKKDNSIISIIRKIKRWFDIRLNKKKWNKISSFYEEIYHEIQAEQPIKSNKFKTMLSRMMLIAKFNNPEFRKLVRRVKGDKSLEWKFVDFENSDFITKKTYYQFLSQKKWSILKSPHGHTWITSDNPGFSIVVDGLFHGDDSVRADPYWMNIDPESMVYFPLSKEYCLRLQPVPVNFSVTHSDDDHIISFEVSTEEEIKAVNKLVFSSKPKVVISEEKGIQQLQCT